MPRKTVSRKKGALPRIFTKARSPVQCGMALYPNGPSTNITRSLGFYIEDYEYGFGQVLVV